MYYHCKNNFEVSIVFFLSDFHQKVGLESEDSHKNEIHSKTPWLEDHANTGERSHKACHEDDNSYDAKNNENSFRAADFNNLNEGSFKNNDEITCDLENGSEKSTWDKNEMNKATDCGKQNNLFIFPYNINKKTNNLFSSDPIPGPKESLSSVQSLDTAEVSQRIREILSAHNIGQRLFARHVLGLSQGTVSELLSKPKHWDKLTEKGRESYRRMHLWANDEQNITTLKSFAPKKGSLTLFNCYFIV